ncbi:hypothetical protein [Actinomadura sp. 3N508]|uniref:hypothetical protein n=1 Tax=Actinomadura sp. 3N508 TaxID=3375153 RepID=UPI00378FFE13
MRQLALHARRLAGTPELAAMLTELSSRGAYERRTALHMAMAARDIAYLQRMLAGPDMGLRRAALRAVRTLPVPDEAVAAVLDDAPADLRRALYRTLLHSRRAALADRLLPEVRARWGDRDAAALLSACTAPTVARRLPELSHAVTAWRALAGRHPGPFIDLADGELADVHYPFPWWRRRRTAIAAASLAAPERALALFERHRIAECAFELPAACLSAFFQVDAARAARVLRAALEGARWWARYHLPQARLRSWPEEDVLAAAPSDPNYLADFLGELPPGRRRVEAFDAAAERAGGRFRGINAMHLLGLLPPDRAAAEARRMLDWHAGVWHSSRSHLDDPEIPLKLTGHLPYEEAAGRLAEAALGGDPRRRGLARALLVACAARTGDSATLLGVVTDLTRRTVNEQDPLRESFLTAVAAVRPVRLFDDAFAAPLEELAVSVAEARDTSAATGRALRALAAQVLRDHDPASVPALVGWAIGVYEKLVARFGGAALIIQTEAQPRARSRRERRRRPRRSQGQRLDRILRCGQEVALYEALRPHLRAARDREDFTLAIGLACSLGRRAWRLDELQGDLRAAALQAPRLLAHAATRLWPAADREHRALDLLEADPSTVELPRVWSVVSRHRTDLLGRLLDQPDWIPEITGREAGRWTPSQRDRVRQRLIDAVHDESRPIATRTAALGSLGRLPGGLGALSSWAESDQIMLAEAALDALARADEPDKSLAILLAQARGPASRVAVAALARCAEAVPPSRLGPELAATLTGPESKVTARKQAARLLEHHRPPGAADTLLRAWDDTELHKDVRVAVAVALSRMPEAPGALEALNAAAGPYASEQMLRTLFQTRAEDYPPAYRPAYAALVRRLLGAADGPGVRFRGAKAFGAWVYWYEGGVDEILATAGDPTAPARTEMAVLLGLLRTGRIRDEVLGVLERLVAAPLDARVHSRVTEIAEALSDGMDRVRWREQLARSAADLLAGHPVHLAGAARMRARVLSAEADVADDLVDLADMMRDSPVLAVQIADGEISRPLHSRRDGRPRPALLFPAARRLQARGYLTDELLALALVQIAGPQTEWAPQWREILDALRRSEHIEIQQRAWQIHGAP